MAEIGDVDKTILNRPCGKGPVPYNINFSIKSRPLFDENKGHT